MKPYLVIATSVFILLSGCSEQNDSNYTDGYKSPAKPNIASVTLSDELSAKYSASCLHCHEQSAMTAPQKGSPQWGMILDKPMSETLERVINGYNGMPPLGQCFDCTEADLETLIQYLSQPKTLITEPAESSDTVDY